MNLECFFKKCWKRYVGAYILKWNLVNAKIVYPQVVQKREGMLELGWAHVANKCH